MALFCLITNWPRLCQSCKMPDYLFDSLGVKNLDFVRITDCTKFIIAQVIMSEEEQHFIEACDTVSCIHGLENDMFPVKSIDVLTSVVLDRVQVEVLLDNPQELMRWSTSDYVTRSVLRILTQFGIVDKCSVKCSRHPTAKAMGIHQINIIETFLSGNQVGRICKTTKIEICRVIWTCHYDQIHRFQKIKLGGLSHSFSYLKDFIESYRFANDNCRTSQFSNEILLIGPSGCGKSSLAKKASYDFGAYLEIVKCSKLMDLSPYDCELYIDSIIKNIDSYPTSQCMLLVEDIENMSASCLNKDSYASDVLLSLLFKMRSKRVIVMGTTTTAKELFPQFRVQGMFHEQIRIGIPGFEERKSILSSLVQQQDIKPSFDLSAIAKCTPGFAGADLFNALLSAKRHKKENTLDSEQQGGTNDFVSTEDLKDAVHDIKPLILKSVDCDLSLKVRPMQWEDIGGMEKIKQKILQRIQISLTPQDSVVPWQPSIGGVLLYGPPGCCKTTLVRALASKWNATFFSASSAQIYSPYVGDSEKTIAQLFHRARLCAPAIIFLDELDCLVGKRATSSINRDIQEKVLSALLNEMDGVCVKLESMQGEQKTMLMEGDKAPSLEGAIKHKSNKGIVVIGATNRPDRIDDALLRPGRFDLLQYMSPPGKKERESILKTLLKRVPSLDVDVAWLAANTKYFSGADLQVLCQIAAGCALKRSISHIKLTSADFEEALKNVLPSLSKHDLMIHVNFSQQRSKNFSELHS